MLPLLLIGAVSALAGYMVKEKLKEGEARTQQMRLSLDEDLEHRVQALVQRQVQHKWDYQERLDRYEQEASERVLKQMRRSLKEHKADLKQITSMLDASKAELNQLMGIRRFMQHYNYPEYDLQQIDEQIEWRQAELDEQEACYQELRYQKKCIKREIEDQEQYRLYASERHYSSRSRSSDRLYSSEPDSFDRLRFSEPEVLEWPQSSVSDVFDRRYSSRAGLLEERLRHRDSDW